MARKEPNNKEPPPPKKTGGLSRRGFLIGGAAAAAGAAYILGGGNKDVSAGDGAYLSVEEAKDLYLDLKQQVEKKLKEAKAAGKPLRIFVLEGHTSTNSLAYNIMLMDIAKRLGINTALLEQSDHTLNLIRDPKNRGLYVYESAEVGGHLEATLDEATRLGRVIGMDTLWPTAEAREEAFRGYIARFAEEEIQKKYQVKNFKLEIIADPYDSRFINAIPKLSGDFFPSVDFSPGGTQENEFYEYLIIARKKADDAMRYERNKEILRTIRNHGSSLIITGKNHGIGLLPPLRKEGQIDIAFLLRTDKNGKIIYKTA